MVTGALAFPGLLSACFSSSGRYAYKPGLQLYTIRDAMAKDPAKALEKVAELGFKLVESATYTGSQLFYGHTPSEFAKLLKDIGLSIPSGHYALGNPETKGTILNGWEKAVEDAHEVGMDYMVCAYLADNERENLDAYKKRAEEFNKAGEICKNAGIQFCYHNHAFEFEEMEDQIPYDILLHETDEDLMKMEMDMYWVTRANLDPIALIQDHPNRFVLWHVKDMENSPDKNFTEVGNGIIDWPKLFSYAKESGLKHFFVEQDSTPGDPFNSIEQSMNYLKENILS